MPGFDININVSRDSHDGYLMTKSIKEQVRQKLIILLMMNPGERMMDPDAGVGLMRFLFNGFVGDRSFYSTITNKIMEQAGIYMKYIEIDEILFRELPESPEAIGLTVEYRIPVLNDVDELTIDYESEGITVQWGPPGESPETLGTDLAW